MRARWCRTWGPVVCAGLVLFADPAFGQNQESATPEKQQAEPNEPKADGPRSKQTERKESQAEGERKQATGPEDDQAQKPPHPPGGPHASGAAGAAARGMMGGQPPRSRSFPDASLPANTVVVEVLDAGGEPVAGAKVRLMSTFQSIAEGNSENVVEKITNETGQVRFSDLDNTMRYSYGVSVQRQGANYDAPGFRLGKVGHRARVYTFPVTADPRSAFIGLQGGVTVTVKDDFFTISGVYRVNNMSRTTWKPQPIFIGLPPDAEAVEAKLSAGDAGFVEAKGGMQLVGTFPPGQKDLPFSFQVPNENEQTRTISMTVPPHTASMNVVTEEAPGLRLAARPGFEVAQSSIGTDDKRVLATRRVMRQGQAPMQQLTIELSGLPVIGPGRWIAVAIAGVIFLLGLAATLLWRRESEDERSAQQERARRALLEEMMLLERARDEGEVGPSTYEQTKREILAALARLEPDPSAA